MKRAPTAQTVNRRGAWLQPLLPLLLLPTLALAQDPAPSETPQPPPSTPFTPSETLEAGSAVAFPVDI